MTERTPQYEAGSTRPPPRWRHRIREAREAAGLNQRQLARLAGIEATNLNTLERGTRQPNVTTLLRIALALEIPLDDLVEIILNPKDANDR